MRRPVLVALLVLVGCASTKVVSTWTNPAFPSRKIQSFAVFASTGYPTGRIEFEQQLTDALRRRGLDAIPGYLREIIGELRLQNHAPSLKITQRQRNYLPRGVIEIE